MLTSDSSSPKSISQRASRPGADAEDERPATSSSGASVPRCPDPQAQAEAATAADAQPYSGEAPTPTRGPMSNRFVRDAINLTPSAQRSLSSSPFRLSMPSISPGQLAYSAMQYLPVPILVLNNLKTVVLANEAMGRMMGLISEDQDAADDPTFMLDSLRGQTLAQVGVDMLQDGTPVWVAWEVFLDSLLENMATRTIKEHSISGDAHTPTGASDEDTSSRRTSFKPVNDTVVDVVISRKSLGKTSYDTRLRNKESEFRVFAKMIISVLEIEERETFFTLTFTSHESSPPVASRPKKCLARTSTLDVAERKTISTSNPSSLQSSRDSNSPSYRVSPGIASVTSSPFPPMGPPSVASHARAPSILQKLILMKDAMLDNTQTPILAMWKDGSVTFPNKAARKLFHPNANLDQSMDGFALLHNWEVWNEDFTRILDPSEYPISTLLRTETPYSSGVMIGMKDSEGRKIVFDVLGEIIRDEGTGEFLAGVVTCRDITKMRQEISDIKEQDEERFRLICDTMPQFVWTTTPDGLHDFFNTRWYTYTGLTPEESLGFGWKNPFHPEDMPQTTARWNHSLKTGTPYVTEYRCRSKDGDWRWFLGRALPLRNKQTGKIEKWFGTCTDVHEGIEAKLAAKRTRQQLLSVIAHSHVTLFTVDTNCKVTMLEGALIWDSDESADVHGSPWYIGQDVFEVFNRLTSQLDEGEKPEFLEPIPEVLAGRVNQDVKEHGIDNRWYRTRFLPMYGKSAATVQDGASTIEGVIGVIMDVTELKAREQELEEQARAKQEALSAEAAAKEANRLKSQFLANMSHEIRTPIWGVLGMAELLADMGLDDTEQRDCVENIYRSANALLTVINDILDFSKIESGRLDIEDLPFSLSVIVRDVCKMLQFTAERKNLGIKSEIADDVEKDLILIGDPGRVRQIITNLLTNSIKFTSEGYVKFSVEKARETEDVVEIKFIVEDTGIGIQDEVRKKLFQPFSQGDASTARKFGGTGLGLTICKNLLDLMHGRITLESTVGTGTTATFWIPFQKPNGPQGESLVELNTLPFRLQSEMSLSCNSSEYDRLLAASPPPGIAQSPFDNVKPPHRKPSVGTGPRLDEELPQSERSKIHVLVVEDNAINQKIATTTVKKLGFTVSASWNGREVLDYLKNAMEGKEKKPNVILMDVQMPRIDGYKCTHLLRRHAPYKSYVKNVPIVAMTASAIQGDREKCERAGMDDYLAKPVKGSVLEHMLVQWIIRQRKLGALKAAVPDAAECLRDEDYCSNAEFHSQNEQEEHSPVKPRRSPRPVATAGSSNRPQTPVTTTIASSGGQLGIFDSPSARDVIHATGRADAGELALKLQAEKLLDAGGQAPAKLMDERPVLQKPQRLTEENIGKLGQGRGTTDKSREDDDDEDTLPGSQRMSGDE